MKIGITGTLSEVNYEFTERKAICFAIADCYVEGQDLIAVSNYCKGVDISKDGNDLIIRLKDVRPHG